MAEGIIEKPAYVDRLTKAISVAIPGATIDDERAAGSRYRFLVVSPSFEGMGHPDRQRVVWDAAEKALTSVDLRNVSMIITMAPSEVG